MGTQVTAVLDSDTKPNYTVAPVLAASVAVVDGEFAVWIGEDVFINLDAYTGLTHCWQALREAGWQNPTTGVVVEAIYDTKLQSFTDTLTEDCAAIIQGFDFTQSGVSNSAHSRRMAESFLESAKAA
jgi:hypothetical protein